MLAPAEVLSKFVGFTKNLTICKVDISYQLVTTVFIYYFILFTCERFGADKPPIKPIRTLVPRQQFCYSV